MVNIFLPKLIDGRYLFLVKRTMAAFVLNQSMRGWEFQWPPPYRRDMHKSHHCLNHEQTHIQKWWTHKFNNKDSDLQQWWRRSNLFHNDDNDKRSAAMIMTSPQQRWWQEVHDNDSMRLGLWTLKVRREGRDGDGVWFD